LSTAVLRAALVIAAIVLGIFVLSKAFPTGQETSPPTAEDQGQTQGQDQGQMTETPTGGGGGGKNTPKPQTSPQVKGVKLAVLNGTDISNLAACTADRLTQLGYQVAEGDVGDASRSYEVTTISYAKQFEADANHIKKELFAKADLHAVGAGAISDVSIALGPDAATGPCESP
jgi:hypothetical protein